MIWQTRLAGAIALGVLTGACDGATPASETEDLSPTPIAEATSPEPLQVQQTAAKTASQPALDLAALQERQNPERVLRFYASAIAAGEWQLAARAWSADAQVTSGMLQDTYGGPSRPSFAFGKGDIEGAAGSLFYEAPLVVTFADNRPEKRGTVVLRRVNDVPGASEEQLRWRIERSTVFSTP